MIDRTNKGRLPRNSRRGWSNLPWSDPTIDDVHGWLREAFDNVVDANSSASHRLRRGEDVLQYTDMLLSTWVDPDYRTTTSNDEVLDILLRAEGVIQDLLNVEDLGDLWIEQDCKTKAAEKLAFAMIALMSAPTAELAGREKLISSLRRTAALAAGFAGCAGNKADLDAERGRGSGTDSPATAAQIASLLFRTADNNERYLASLH